MKKTVTGFILLFLAGLAFAASAQANFSGSWTFDAAQSKNVGMMAQGKIHTTVSQTKLKIVVDDNSEFNGQKDTQHTVYDLTGKPITNTSMMAGQATTRSHWEGARLITDWESPAQSLEQWSSVLKRAICPLKGRRCMSSRPGRAKNRWSSC
jgi:hypothetical protein